MVTGRGLVTVVRDEVLSLGDGTTSRFPSSFLSASLFPSLFSLLEGFSSDLFELLSVLSWSLGFEFESTSLSMLVVVEGTR